MKQSLRHETSVFFSELSIVLLTIFYYRQFIYFYLDKTFGIDSIFFFKVTTMLAIGLVLVAFANYTPLTWRIKKNIFIFLMFGMIFQVVALAQGSTAGMMYSIQIFIVPFLVNWVVVVRRELVKFLIAFMLIGSTIFIVIEFVSLNNSWLELLTPHSPLYDFAGDWRASVSLSTIEYSELSKEAAESAKAIFATRPYGILGYITNSAVAISMFTSFFLIEALAYRRIKDIVVALIGLFGLVLTTSGTGIVAHIMGVVVVTFMLRSEDAIVFQPRFSTVFLITSFLILMTLLWPMLYQLYVRITEAIATDPLHASSNATYVDSFTPGFRSMIDVARYFVGGNFWELNVMHELDKGWTYKGQTALVRESNFINFFAFFGVIPMIFVYKRWLKPLWRLKSRVYKMDVSGLPFLTAFITGIFTMIHQNGIVFWQNTFFFFIFYEMACRYQKSLKPVEEDAKEA